MRLTTGKHVTTDAVSHVSPRPASCIRRGGPARIHGELSRSDMRSLNQANPLGAFRLNRTSSLAQHVLVSHSHDDFAGPGRSAKLERNQCQTKSNAIGTHFRIVAIKRSLCAIRHEQASANRTVAK